MIATLKRQACSTTMASTLAPGATKMVKSATFGTTARNISCVTRPRAAAKVSAWLSQLCCPGPQSVFVTDLKGELYELTAGWRQEHAHNKSLALRAGRVLRLVLLQSNC